MNRLGKGLGAIFNENSYLSEEPQGNEKIVEIDIETLKENPYQPRKIFDESKIEELAQSIKEHGVIQPIIVKQSQMGYYIVAGERRYRACKKLGLKKIPAIVRDIPEQVMAEIALLENIQRENLTIVEEALAYQLLMDKYSYSQQDVADKVHKSRAHIANTVRLLKLPTEVQQMINEGNIEFGHAKILAGIEDTNKILKLADKINEEKLSVRALEQLLKDEETIKELQKEKNKEVKIARRDVHLDYLEDKLISRLGTSVKIVSKEKDGGKVVIDFSNDTDLNRILDIMNLADIMNLID